MLQMRPWMRRQVTVLVALSSVCRTAGQVFDGSQFNASDIHDGQASTTPLTGTPRGPDPTPTVAEMTKIPTPPSDANVTTPVPTPPPMPTPGNDTIQFLPRTTLPSPVPTMSVTSSEQLSLLPYSVAGGLCILAIICVILFVMIRRHRESEVRQPPRRTQDMSEMFLSTSSRQEQPDIQSVDSDDTEFRLDDSSASLDIVDDTFYDESLPSSPRPYFSEKSDSYRSSLGSEPHGSVTIFFDDFNSERSESTASDCSLDFIRDSEMSRL